MGASIIALKSCLDFCKAHFITAQATIAPYRGSKKVIKRLRDGRTYVRDQQGEVMTLVHYQVDPAHQALLVRGPDAHGRYVYFKA